MPRKKQSRAPSRAKPCPASVSFAPNIDEEERQRTLEKKLEDFDRKIEETVQQMESDKKDFLDTIRNFYFVNERNTPAAINKMLWQEFLHLNDPAYSAKPVVRQSIASIINAAETQLTVKITKKKPIRAQVEETASLRRSQRTRTNGENVPPTATMRLPSRVKKASGQESLNTPLNYGFAFPHQMMVTPKFDPRTPMPQSTLRKAKPGEIIMSLKGSPVQLGTKEWLDTLTLNGLDDRTKEELKDFHSQVAKMLKIDTDN